MKTAIIIGTGFLGEQIYKDIAPICDEIILTHNKKQKFPDSKKFDFFTDDIEDILKSKKIDTVFFPAKIEINDGKTPEELEGAMIRFLEACKDSRIIYISSDGMFDGKRGAYKESDEMNPVTPYGKNLKICEEAVKKCSSNYCIIRPSYIYGYVGQSLDKRFEKVKQENSAGKKIIRFTDMYKSPLSYQQVSEAIVKLATSDYQGVVHVGGEKKSVYELTKEGMEALGMSTENLIGEPMPKVRPVDFLPDTSLDNSLMKKLTDIKPFSIKEGFENSKPKFIDKNALLNKFLK